MKTHQWFCVVAVIALTTSWSNSATAMTTSPDTLATLIGWADPCFAKLPEYDSGVRQNNAISRFANNSGITDDNINDLYTNYTASRIKRSGDDQLPFVKKIHIPLGSTLCFMGDLHGSLHSLLRNLLRLYTKSFIADDWRLAPGKYLIFLGDFVDQGSYGTECWCTLMKLASINPEQVILVQGNHEEIRYQKNNEQTHNHIASELYYKVAGENDPKLKTIFNTFLSFCSTLPLAVFLSPIKSDNTHDYVQCSHGGIEPRFNTQAFLASTDTFKDITASDGYGVGFYWSDFTGVHYQYRNILNKNYDCKKTQIASWQNPAYNWTLNDHRGAGFIANIPETQEYLRGAGFIAGITDTKEYLRESTLKAFFRGHQDMGTSFKLVVQNLRGVVEWSYLTRINTTDKTALESTGIPMAEFVNQPDTVPVFTFTTATEARSDDEGFGIVTMAEDFNQWKIKPHIYTNDEISFDKQSIELLEEAKKKEAFEKTVNNLLLTSSIDLHKQVHQLPITSMDDFIKKYGIPSDQQINTSIIYLKILENKLGMLQAQLIELKTKLSELGAAVTAITTN